MASPLTETAEYKALQAHHEQTKNQHMRAEEAAASKAMFKAKIKAHGVEVEADRVHVLLVVS